MKNFNWFREYPVLEFSVTFSTVGGLIAKYRMSLKNPRLKAFYSQNGKCYCCGQPMWTEDPNSLPRQYRLSKRQVKQLFCTGEHLTAHSDGGTASKANIVAACWYCNKRRHARKRDIEPHEYERLVRDRLSKGRWHGLSLISL